MFFENSEEFASSIPQTFLANSITAHCNPKHIPKNGMLFFLMYSIAEIFPSIPLYPNPPGTITRPYLVGFLFQNCLHLSSEDQVLLYFEDMHD